MKVPPRFLDLSGARYGRLIAIEFLGLNNYKKSVWLCRCDCGKEKTITVAALRNGGTSSCGCLRSELLTIAVKARAKHNLSKDLVYSSWSNMIQRCCQPKRWDFKFYGGRGIKVCDFLKQSPVSIKEIIGDRPAKMTLDRINNSKGNYTCGKCQECLTNKWPMNIKWSTSSQQCRNRRSNHVVEIDGISKCVTEWSESSGVKYRTLMSRINKGWTGSELLLPNIKPWSRKNLKVLKIKFIKN